MCSGISHITGGGFYENIPRCLPKGAVRPASRKPPYSVPPIFRLIQETGDIPERDMYNTFNMGDRACASSFRRKRRSTALDAAGTGRASCVWKIGEVISGGEGVELMVRIAVLVSGGGTNLQALMDAQDRGELGPAAHRLCDLLQPQGRLCAGARAGSTAASRRTCCPGRLMQPDPEKYDEALLQRLKAQRIDLIVLAGFLGICGRKRCWLGTPDAF